MKNLPLMYFEAKPPKLQTQLASILRSHKDLLASLLDFIEDDTTRLVYSEEANNSRDRCEDSQQLEV